MYLAELESPTFEFAQLLLRSRTPHLQGPTLSSRTASSSQTLESVCSLMNSPHTRTSCRRKISGWQVRVPYEEIHVYKYKRDLRILLIGRRTAQAELAELGLENVG
jgi:hypothetical protein